MKLNSNAAGFAFALAVFCFVSSAPGSQVCVQNPGVGPDICVKWTFHPNPQLNTDFEVDFTDSTNPAVVLITGDTTWNVWSDDNGSPGNIGSITLDPSVSTADFLVELTDGTNVGADEVGTVNLTATGWTGHSSITNGKIFEMNGNLTVVKDGAGDGGAVTLGILGDVSGNLSIQRILSLLIDGNVSGDMNIATIPAGGGLTVGGNVTTTSSIAVGEMKDNQGSAEAKMTVEGNVEGFIEFDRIGDGADFLIEGDLSGDVTMNGDLDRGNFSVLGNVTSTSTITIEHLGNYAHVILTGTEIAGDVIFKEGVPEAGNQIQIHAELAAGGTIDLTNDNVVGALQLFGGGSGNVINGGAVTDSGLVVLGNGASTVFSGTATFSQVDAGSGGINLDSGADLNGTVKVTGNVSGPIEVHGTLNGDVDVSGNVSGEITIDEDVAFGGEVFINGSLTGTVEIGGDVNGSVGALGELGALGEILVDGLLSREIAVGQGTHAQSLIRITEGIGTGAALVINSTQIDAHANGDIHIGPSTGIPNITFDGRILIRAESGGPGGGNLNGTITVVGCHATSADLDICICGKNNGTVTITQTGCANQVIWKCVSGC